MTLPTGRPAVMGILNVTPDSFSDGGRNLDVDSAVRSASLLQDDGADLIDIGGESTRPGSEPISVEVEISRVVPVLRALAGRGMKLSIDTMKHQVAAAALDWGVDVVNDVSALRDDKMLETLQASSATMCLMHMQGEPATMQAAPCYENVVTEVLEFLVQRAQMVIDAGIGRDRIWIDPGIGFGKAYMHNLQLIRALGLLVDTGYPVLIGVSRKGFLGTLGSSACGPLAVEDRWPAALTTQLVAQLAGVKVIRTHDVKMTRTAIQSLVSVKG